MFRVGIGVGGTFTDLVAIEEESAEIITTKSPSTPLEPEKGVLNVLEKSKIKPENIKSIVHGTTIATNALIEKKLTTNVGFIATEGFKDIPFIQRTNRKHHYDLTWIKPKPFVLRENCFEINERLNYKGETLKKINAKEVKKVIKRQNPLVQNGFSIRRIRSS